MYKMQYHYQLLQNNDTIRILTLDPAQWDDPLAGTLEAVPIDHAGSYEAVSYVWADPGPPNRAYNILIRDGDAKEGMLVLKGGSIFGALIQLRLSDRPRRIWADQCCINQDDPAERSQQLHFMDRIYRDAAHVLVWLGLDTKAEAMAAFGLVRELDDVLRNHSVRDISPISDMVVLRRLVRENQKTLQALTDRAWVRLVPHSPTLAR